MVKMRDRWAEPIVHAGFKRLLEEIHLVKPNIIVALGSTALWALNGAWGITKWRGSQLTVAIPSDSYPCLLYTSQAHETTPCISYAD